MKKQEWEIEFDKKFLEPVCCSNPGWKAWKWGKLILQDGVFEEDIKQFISNLQAKTIREAVEEGWQMGHKQTMDEINKKLDLILKKSEGK